MPVFVDIDPEDLPGQPRQLKLPGMPAALDPSGFALGIETELRLIGGGLDDPELGDVIGKVIARLESLGSWEGEQVTLARDTCSLSGGRFVAVGPRSHRVYCDCGGLLEVATGEEHDPTALVLGRRRLFRLVQQLLEAERPGARLYSLSSDSADLLGLGTEPHTYGCHRNFFVARPRRLDVPALKRLLAFLVTRPYLVPSGGLSSRSPTGFTHSARAPFIVALQHTRGSQQRGMLSRFLDGDLRSGRRPRRMMAGGAEQQRYEDVTGDHLRSELAETLLLGATALTLRALESGAPCGDRAALEEPSNAVELLALVDRDFEGRQPLHWNATVEMSAHEVQRLFLAQVGEFARRSGLVELDWVRLVLELWEETLRRLEEGDWFGLSQYLDGHLKRQVMLAKMERAGLDPRHLPALVRAAGRALPEGSYPKVEAFRELVMQTQVQWGDLGPGNVIDQYVDSGLAGRFRLPTPAGGLPAPAPRNADRAALMHGEGSNVLAVHWSSMLLKDRRGRAKHPLERIVLTEAEPRAPFGLGELADFDDLFGA